MAWRYVTSLLAVGVAAVVHLGLDPILGQRSLFIPFLIAIVCAAWLGIGPSLAAWMLSLIFAAYLFFEPRHALSIKDSADQLGLALNACAGLMIVLSAELWRRGARVRAIEDSKKQQQKVLERVELLSSVASQLLTSERPQEVIDSLCHRVIEHLGCDVFLNFLFDSNVGRLHLNACGGVSPEIAREAEWLDLGGGGCGWVAQNAQRLVVEDVDLSSDARMTLVQALGGKAYACHPLMNQREMIGTLSFVSRTKTRFTEDELELMQTVSDHVAIAIQRMRLLESVEQRAAEAEEGRRILDALMERLPMGIAIADAEEKRVRMVSRAGWEMMGRQQEPLTDVSLDEIAARWHVLRADGSDLATPEEIPLARAILDGEVVKEAEMVLHTKEGQHLPVLVTAAPIYDSDGRIAGAVAGWQDITERKQAERALVAAHEELELKVQQRTEQLARANAELEAQVDQRRRAEERLQHRNELLQMVVDHIPVMLVHYDANFRFFFVNKEFERLTGWTIEEARQIDTLEVLLPDRAVLEQAKAFMAATEAGWRDFTITTRSGNVLETTWANLRLSDGSSIGIGLDISERLRSHGQLESLNRALSQRAEQLQAMALELTQSEERERHRLAQVLHDHLQQILVAARMKIAMLRRRVLDERSDQAMAQIDDLLNQSIAESRSLTVELSPPVLYDAGLAAGLAWLGRQTEEKHGLEVHVQVEPDTEPADQGTKIILFQAVRELLFNVVKHARATFAEVAMSRTQGQLCLEVRDNGTGFAPERLTHRGEGRSGFGLFSIRERLELIGGRLEFDTAPGQGTRVVIVAPLETARLPVAAPSVGTISVVQGPGDVISAGRESKGRTVRVLLADDHPILRKGLADVLSEQPEIELVGEAGDGEEVVELARQTRPDVVVMDVTMPNLSGIEATRRIVNELPKVRVIGLSMHEQGDMASAMREAGAVAYLCKNHPTDVLISIILHPVQSLANA